MYNRFSLCLSVRVSAVMRLNDKVAIVTGAGSGIGLETSILFAKEGASIVLADVNEKAGKGNLPSSYFSRS